MMQMVVVTCLVLLHGVGCFGGVSGTSVACTAGDDDAAHLRKCMYMCEQKQISSATIYFCIQSDPICAGLELCYVKLDLLWLWTTGNSQGKHLHAVWADFGEEMARVEGAVVVRRPGFAETPDRIAPAHTLDYATTLRSYFAIFRSSLLPRFGTYAWRRVE